MTTGSSQGACEARGGQRDEGDGSRLEDDRTAGVREVPTLEGRGWRHWRLQGSRDLDRESERP